MTSEGSPYSRFARAVARGNPLSIQLAATELPRVGMDDALAVCLSYLDARDAARYSLSISRWTARYCDRRPIPTAAEAGLVVVSLQALETDAWPAAASGLSELFALRRLSGCERVLSGWRLRREARETTSKG